MFARRSYTLGGGVSVLVQALRYFLIIFDTRKKIVLESSLLSAEFLISKAYIFSKGLCFSYLKKTFDKLFLFL